MSKDKKVETPKQPEITPEQKAYLEKMNLSLEKIWADIDGLSAKDIALLFDNITERIKNIRFTTVAKPEEKK